ncbi:MAG: KpsF/GutQ family sugar-phosphate isomerase [Candidatus Aminicenantes bacterium]|nr:KpsF/GutQ family sugar-phosphate isomerase [Candidatus Aminicenantes bacterium]
MGSIETGKKVLETEANAILNALGKINQQFATAVSILFECRGQVVVTGMGKSGLIGRKIAATMTSIGSPALFLHPAEAIHGDIGIIHPQDVVIALSTSGETEEVIRLLNYIKRLGIRLIALVGNPDSTLARQSDVFIDCSVEKEACPIGLVPSASSTLTLAVGDALSIALMEKRGFNEENFRDLHPGGALGKKLLKVKHLMHSGEQMPVVDVQALMENVIRVINEKKFGIAIVVKEKNRVAGVITDGDLRRLFLKGINFAKTKAADCMTVNPLSIGEDKLAVEALKIMEDRAVTSLVVQDGANRLCGLLHLHDLWRTEMI